MADRNKFEEMLERLINEDKAGAEELFHEIVVEKSRDIYEGLLENDLDDEEVDEATDEEVDESDDEEVDEATDEEVDESDDEEVDEGFDLDEFEVEGDDEPEMDMDEPEMDMDEPEMDDMDDDDEEGSDDPEEAAMDAMDDLSAALKKLQDEFDNLVGDKGDDEGEDEAMDQTDAFIDDVADEAAFEEDEVEEATDEEVDEATDEEVDESVTPKSETEQMREYVEKITATMGDNGDNTKSPVAGKNDMGGDASNLVQGGDGGNGGTQGGLAAPTPKEDDLNQVNKPGAKAADSMKPMTKGHGAEKKGAGETADNKKSTIGS